MADKKCMLCGPLMNGPTTKSTPNVYARTRKEREGRLKALIVEMKSESAEVR